MDNKRFIQRLNQEFPKWIQKEWISGKSAEEILKSLSDSDIKPPSRLVFYLSLLGVILFGTGVITFFAAHWNGISKIVKLTLLLGGMWSAYGLSLYFRETRPSSPLWHTLLLLGVILFGANIFLIAQIYHIDSHYPNGILLWSIGALSASVLLESQPSMFPAIFLCLLWSGFEMLDFHQDVFWPFLVLWTLSLIPIFIHQWKPALHIALIGLIVWSLMVFSRLTIRTDWKLFYLIQTFFLAYLGLFILGRLLETYSRTALFSRTFQKYTLFAQLFCIYIFTYPDIHRIGWMFARDPNQIQPSGNWLSIWLLLLAIIAGFLIWFRQRAETFARTPLIYPGYGILAVILFLFFFNDFIPGARGNLIAVSFNLIFFAGLVWLVYFGVQERTPFTVNLAFSFFALTVISRYFDTFWSLLNRSYFFMVGGLFLIGGGLFLERQRRKLTGTMK